MIVATDSSTDVVCYDVSLLLPSGAIKHLGDVKLDDLEREIQKALDPFRPLHTVQFT